MRIIKKEILDSFEGNYRLLILFVVIGVFLPPVLAFSGVYFLAKTYDKDPEFFDYKILTFFLILTGYLVFIGAMVGDNIFNMFKVSVLGSIILTIMIYPFVHIWVKYDYNLHKKRIRGIQDTKIGKYMKYKFEEFENSRKKSLKSKRNSRNIHSKHL
jgi:hypothetical protein